MSIDGLPPVSNTPMLQPMFSDWGTKFVAPLGSSLMSKDGMFELAGRVYWIVGLVIAAVIIARKYGYLTGRTTPPDLSSTNHKDRLITQAEHLELKQRVERLEQLLQQVK